MQPTGATHQHDRFGVGVFDTTHESIAQHPRGTANTSSAARPLRGVTAVGASAGDIVAGAGATLSALRAAGVDVLGIVLTDADSADDPHLAEQQATTQLATIGLDAASVAVLGLPATSISDDIGTSVLLHQTLAERGRAADVLVTYSPNDCDTVANTTHATVRSLVHAVAIPHHTVLGMRLGTHTADCAAGGSITSFDNEIFDVVTPADPTDIEAFARLLR